VLHQQRASPLYRRRRFVGRMRQVVRGVFDYGWVVESIQEARFEVRPDLEDIHFSEGGPYAWFCVIRRME